MASKPCPREAEVVKAAWSEPSVALEADLAAHVATCEECAEALDLARVFADAGAAARAAARPPSAGAVWWRAQRRAREEAALRAARPISFVHGIALGCACAAVVAVLGLCAAGIRAQAARWLASLSFDVLPSASAVDMLQALPYGALLVLGATILLAPVALYLALSEE